MGACTSPREPALNPVVFRSFCRIANEQAGLHLKEGKEALVRARVSKRMRHLGLPEALRPPQETPDPDDDPTREWREWHRRRASKESG